MEKILLPLNGQNVDMDILRFSFYLAEMTHSTLTAAFIEDLNVAGAAVLTKSQYIPYEETNEFLRFQRNQEIPDPVAESIQLFKEACVKSGIRYEVYHFTFQEIIMESRFSDLIIIDPRLMGSNLPDDIPTKFVKNLLSMAECPVIISPENYHEIKEVIHCYDGSKSSVFAIKQFTYLFPELIDLKCILLQVNKDNEWSIEKEEEMKQWLKSHYSQCGFEILHGDVGDELQQYIEADGRRDAFVTMGAYGRNAISTLIRESRANILIKNMSVPLFISHQ